MKKINEILRDEFHELEKNCLCIKEPVLDIDIFSMQVKKLTDLFISNYSNNSIIMKLQLITDFSEIIKRLDDFEDVNKYGSLTTTFSESLDLLVGGIVTTKEHVMQLLDWCYQSDDACILHIGKKTIDVLTELHRLIDNGDMMMNRKILGQVLYKGLKYISKGYNLVDHIPDRIINDNSLITLNYIINVIVNYFYYTSIKTQYIIFSNGENHRLLILKRISEIINKIITRIMLDLTVSPLHVLVINYSTMLPLPTLYDRKFSAVIDNAYVFSYKVCHVTEIDKIVRDLMLGDEKIQHLIKLIINTEPYVNMDPIRIVYEN
jgi:hypothetical protein